MTQTVWGETTTRSRRRGRRKNRQQKTTAPYSITGTGNDCEIIGHTEGYRDLAGCTVCLDCGVTIFCPQCIAQHPTDPKAVPVLCPLHEEKEGSA
jgi:hypothetical protein